MPAIYPPYPGTPLQLGSSGSNVSTMQSYLNTIRVTYPTLNKLTVDGKFGQSTKTTVIQYQTIKVLKADGIIGKNTWDSIVTDYHAIVPYNPNKYPGTPLKVGSKGEPVTFMELKLNFLADTYTAIMKQTVDGSFGSTMEHATKLFQKQFSLTADGVIGESTWNKIVSVYTVVDGGGFVSVSTKYPGNPVSIGDTGDSVRFIQSYMSEVPGLFNVSVDGKFGSGTKSLVKAFQTKYSLTSDGVVGSATWSKMVNVFNAL